MGIWFFARPHVLSAAPVTFSRQGKVAYVHLRHVRGKVPFYKGTFVDEGDVDILRVLRILKRNRFSGGIIPDHAPQVTCAAPWHAGMAYALGYIRTALQSMQAAHALRDIRL